MSLIRHNIEVVQEKVGRAAERAGRGAEEVRLMVVTKTQARELVEEAYEAGIRLFGENRIAEAAEKFERFHSDAELHMIGHLQRNKAARAAAIVRCVQSIDKLETAAALDRRCAEIGRTMEIYLEVNTSGESTKEGFRSDDELFRALDSILLLDNVAVSGLMTIGPFTDEEALIRRSFRRLAALREEVRRRVGERASLELSMGMTNDFEIAIEEGSTLVRVGTAIFGPRARQ